MNDSQMVAGTAREKREDPIRHNASGDGKCRAFRLSAVVDCQMPSSVTVHPDPAEVEKLTQELLDGGNWPEGYEPKEEDLKRVRDFAESFLLQLDNID